jgi:hypothetical protein
MATFWLYVPTNSSVDVIEARNAPDSGVRIPECAQH